MKLEFCAVCGTTKDLHQHHIEPVVLTGIKRKKTKKYDGDKKLKDCTSMEVFGWLFDQGVITDDGEITVCSYHHNILHGIVKFQAAEHSTLIREGMEKAKQNGVKMGRPISPLHEFRQEIIEKRTNGESIRSLSKEYDCGIGTIYKLLRNDYVVDEQKEVEPILVKRTIKTIESVEDLLF